MIKYLEFSTLIEAEGYADANGAPTPYGLAVKTYRYAKPVLHPKANALLFKDGRAVCAVDKNGESDLIAAEKAALKMPGDVAEFFPSQGA